MMCCFHSTKRKTLKKKNSMKSLTKQQENPPEPVLTIEVPSEVIRELKAGKYGVYNKNKSNNILTTSLITIDKRARTLTIRIHLMRERPKPQIAPYRPAMVLVRQKDKQKPIQLNRKATRGNTNFLLGFCLCFVCNTVSFYDDVIIKFRQCTTLYDTATTHLYDCINI